MEHRGAMSDVAGEVGRPSTVSSKGGPPGADRVGKGQEFPTYEPRKGDFGRSGVSGPTVFA